LCIWAATATPEAFDRLDKNLSLFWTPSWRRFGALDTPKKEVQKISPAPMRKALLRRREKPRCERKKPSLSISFRADAFFPPVFPSIARGRDLGTRRPSRSSD
tara:strand:- start:298 stop:606 length:309 start_codon:yes stop_codon:yes gene_type:complete